MKKALLLVGILALIFPVSIVHSSELHSVDPRHVFKISLENDFPIRLSPRIHILRVPKRSDQLLFHDVVRALEADLFTLSLRLDDQTRLITLGRFEGLEWDPNVFY